MEILNKKLAILGFGQEGRAVLRFIKKNSPGISISILDRRLDKNYLQNLKKFDVIYRSPGVRYNLKEIQKAIKDGVKFSSATDLFFKNAKGLIIGVTGTKGKGTTSTLIYKILKSAGKDVYLAGNIGKPAVNILPKLEKNSITVLELSSFQLQDLKHSPHIAVVLDTFPDHMDAHKNLKEYFEAKSSIARYQTKKGRIFYAASNKHARNIAAKSKGKKIAVNSKIFKLFKPENIKIRGEHNFKNAVMAATVAASLGINKKIILNTVKNYRGLPYRLQLARTIRITPHTKNFSVGTNQYKSVFIKIYNDSASTNPITTAAAVKSFKEKNVLIMGGKDKRLDYKPVAQALQNSSTKFVALFGENKKKIAKAIRSSKVKVASSKNLKSAVQLAYQKAKSYKLKTKSLVIIFSPGAASFDMFVDYKDRGKKFNEIVKKTND